MKKLPLTFLLLILTVNIVAQSSQEEKALNTLQEFEEAIVMNNAAKAKELLHPEALILEGASIETQEEYLSHHFHSDGKFLSAMGREVLSQQININENTAWVTTKSHLTGTYNAREIDLQSLELAVLNRVDGVWKIMAVHWSSANN